MAVLDLLQRLRPAGAPGPAGPVAVPAEDVDAAAAELTPVLDALADVLADCEAIRNGAAGEAAETLARAQREASAVVADATARAAAERAAAAARVNRSADAEADSLLREARQVAAQLRADGRRRMAELAGVVVTNIRTGR